MGVDSVVLVRFLLMAVALQLISIALVTWSKRNDAPGAKAFAVLIAFMAVYAFGYSGEVGQTSLEAARHWLDIEYLVLPWTPALWLIAASRQNGVRLPEPLLFVIPVVTFVGHYTNFRNLFYAGPMTMVHREPFWVLDMPRGPLSMLDNAYLLVAFLAGAWMYLSGLRQASPLFRKQATVLLLGSLIPFLAYFLYLAGLSPWGLDMSPFSFSVTCALFYYGLFHCGIFELAPLARNLIFNSMRDAVLVLDNQNRLLDINSAARTLLPVLEKFRPGSQIASLFSDNPDLAQALKSGEDAAEFRVEGELNPNFFEVRTWPLLAAQKQVGRAIILVDITPQVRLREELRTRSETDALTGVANRRRLLEALDLQQSRFGVAAKAYSLLMIDLDFFKGVNDEHGHLIGDGVLRSVAERLKTTIRKSDLLARYGGEEFAVLLPETAEEEALTIAERIRTAICQSPFEVDRTFTSLTVSIGVAIQDGLEATEPAIVLKSADLALYRAKAAGRNRVERV